MNKIEENKVFEPIELSKGISRLTLYPKGGRISRLLLNAVPIFFNGLRPDGREGSTHVSAPWMGPFKSENKIEGKRYPQHGTARDGTWETFHHADQVSQSILRFNSEVLKAHYPDLTLFQTLGLEDDRFHHVLTFHNKADIAQPMVNPGLHWYFSNPEEDLTKIIINSNSYTLDNWLEAHIIPASTQNQISIPGLGELIVRTNFPNLALWSMEEDGKSKFACIEPIFNPDDIDNAPLIPARGYKNYHASIIHKVS